mgnify:CR=1 FL=1
MACCKTRSAFCPWNVQLSLAFLLHLKISCLYIALRSGVEACVALVYVSPRLVGPRAGTRHPSLHTFPILTSGGITSRAYSMEDQPYWPGKSPEEHLHPSHVSLSLDLPNSPTTQHDVQTTLSTVLLRPPKRFTPHLAGPRYYSSHLN